MVKIKNFPGGTFSTSKVYNSSSSRTRQFASRTFAPIMLPPPQFLSWLRLCMFVYAYVYVYVCVCDYVYMYMFEYAYVGFLFGKAPH